MTTENYSVEVEGTEETGRTSTNWVADRENCDSEGELDDRCNLIAAGTFGGKLQVVSKTLSCGCVLYREEEEEKPE